MKRLGAYELLRPIGRGGMGKVWMGRRASLAGTAKAVAIKILDPVAGNEASRERFFREARVSMLLSHSNIVQVFDVEESNGTLFLVMEWVDGLDLGRLNTQLREEENKLDCQVAAYVVGELLRALDYAHTLTHGGVAQRIVHRDVSPQNVLLSLCGEVKLADFGIARVAADVTTGMHIQGKLRYMAPEQVAGVSSSPVVDLYAVGAILHELLDGRPFRHDRTEAEMLDDVAQGVVPPLHADVPPELAALRECLLQRDPRARIQSAAQARAQLVAWNGYRDAAGPLAQLVRDVVGVGAPRSGVILSAHAGDGDEGQDMFRAPRLLAVPRVGRSPAPRLGVPRPVEGDLSVPSPFRELTETALRPAFGDSDNATVTATAHTREFAEREGRRRVGRAARSRPPFAVGRRALEERVASSGPPRSNSSRARTRWPAGWLRRLGPPIVAGLGLALIVISILHRAVGPRGAGDVIVASGVVSAHAVSADGARPSRSVPTTDSDTITAPARSRPFPRSAAHDDAVPGERVGSTRREEVASRAGEAADSGISSGSQWPYPAGATQGAGASRLEDELAADEHVRGDIVHRSRARSNASPSRRPRYLEQTRETGSPAVETSSSSPGASTVEVTLKTGEFRFVYVRVDNGPPLALEPVQRIELKPGRHRLEWSETGEDPWRPGGVIRLQPERAYVVRMRRSASAQLRQVP